MSRVAVIIVLAITAALSVAAAILLRQPPPAASGPLLAFDPAQVTSVTFQESSGASRLLARTPERAGEPAFWTATLRGSDGSTFTRRADSEALLAALTTLARTPHAGVSDPPSETGASTLTLETPSGRLSLTIARTSLAGRVPVLAQTGAERRALFAPFDTLSFFIGAPAKLLEPAVFRWTAEPVAISLTRGAEKISFERAGRQWNMTAPFAAPADRASLGRVQAALTTLKLAAASAAVPRIGATPDLVATVIFGLGESGSVQSVGQTLALYGKTGDLEARYSGPLGDADLILKNPDLAPLFAETAAYLAKESVASPAADVMAVTLGKPTDGLAALKSFRRAELNWTVGAGPETLPAADARSLTAILTLLCAQPAAAVLTTSPTDFEPLATVSLTGSADTPIASLTLGLSTPPTAAAGGRSRRVLTVLSGTGTHPLARLYAIESDDPILTWIAAKLP